jgi:nucleoside 2-deoxyribosyltransferase
MAMQYGDPLLTRIVNEHFRPAVRDTGFRLIRLDDEPKAGLIDNRLRVEIQSARFLIADLTHENSGAYWEAGYAEGLGKPVIYTCEASIWKAKKTHFDTNHSQTVVWTEENIKSATEELKATIRVTIPEATRQD